MDSTTTAERIKDRVRKLMAYANDGAASAGEIENAMAHAAKLIDQHNLDVAELGTAETADVKMGRHFGRTGSSKIYLWEGHLATAVEGLYGSVKVYASTTPVVSRVDGVVQLNKDGSRKFARTFAFYGPDDDATDAAALYEEWNRSIVTMALMRWGAAYKGEGGSYCEGFVQAIQDKVYAATRHRIETPAAKPAPLLPSDDTNSPTTALTIAAKNDITKAAAAAWLKEECGVDLTTGVRRSGATGSQSSRAEGYSHGQTANFAKRTSIKTRLLAN